jgi:hypothetical protein
MASRARGGGRHSWELPSPCVFNELGAAHELTTNTHELRVAQGTLQAQQSEHSTPFAALTIS